MTQAKPSTNLDVYKLIGYFITASAAIFYFGRLDQKISDIKEDVEKIKAIVYRPISTPSTAGTALYNTQKLNK